MPVKPSESTGRALLIEVIAAFLSLKQWGAGYQAGAYNSKKVLIINFIVPSVLAESV
jgi:hypothetical protein